MNEYTIAIDKYEFDRMENEARDEYVKNANNDLILKCRALKGTWIETIAAKINEFENTSFSMLGKNGRINRNKKQGSAKFFTGNGKQINRFI